MTGRSGGSPGPGGGSGQVSSAAQPRSRARTPPQGGRLHREGDGGERQSAAPGEPRGQGRASEQRHGRHERRGQEPSAHEVSADDHGIKKIEDDSCRQGAVPAFPAVERRRDSGADRQECRRVEAQGVREVFEAVPEEIQPGESRLELGISGVRKQEAIIKERERLPGDQRKEAESHGGEPARGGPGEHDREERRGEKDEQIEARRGDERGEQHQTERPTVRGRGRAQPGRQKQRQQEMDERVLEAGGRVVQERPGKEQRGQP